MTHIRPGIRAALGLVAAALLPTAGSAATVFPGGTIFVSADIVTASDPSALSTLTPAGTGLRTMFDRRVGAFVTVEVFLFDAVFADGLTSEIQVNAEFGSVAAAQAEADFYGYAIGQLPTALRADVQEVWIHMGVEPWGGGNDSILIHTGQGALYQADGILEETLIHEAAHTSLDAAHASHPDWIAAQAADGMFISPYAEQNPGREDIAETFLMYLAARQIGGIAPETRDLVEAGVPNRLAYFDAQGFELYPYPVAPVPVPGALSLAVLGMGCLGALGLGRRRA